MLIEDLPIEIQKVVFKRQKEQGNTKNKNVLLDDDKSQGNFTWDKSIEGFDFWKDINYGDFTEFYKKYPNYIKGNWYKVTNDSHIGCVIKYDYTSENGNICFTEGFLSNKVYCWNEGFWSFASCILEPFDIAQYSHLFPADHELYKPMTYQHNPIPTDGKEYFKAKVVKDIIKKDIRTYGFLPDIIPAGSITWFHSSYKKYISHDEECCPENNRFSANIPGYYFEIIEDEPKFIVGKWYKNTKSGKYGKLAFPLPIDKSLFPCTEFIDCGEYYNDGTSYSRNWMDNLIEVDLSEIQKYLPEGHPDKIKTVDMKEIQEECKRRFPIGCKYKFVSSPNDELVLLEDSTVYSIYGNYIYASRHQGCLYKDGKYAELVSLPEIKSKDIKLEKGKYYCINFAGDLYIEKIKAVDYDDDVYESHGYINIKNKTWNLPDECYNICEIKEFREATLDEISWWDICYYKNKYIPSKEDLIEEAKKKYPIGTKFYPAHLMFKDSYCTVTNDNFKVNYGTGVNVIALTKTGRVYPEVSDEEYEQNTYNRNVYTDGKWADIVEEPSVKPVVKPTNNYIDVGFKIGDRVIFGKQDSIILGFNKNKSCCVIQHLDYSGGNCGNGSEYWYDDYGNKIEYKPGGNRWFVNVRNLKKLPDSNTPNISQEQYITGIEEYPTTSNQSFLINKPKNSLDTTIQKVSSISTKLKQKSKTIKF